MKRLVAVVGLALCGALLIGCSSVSRTTTTKDGIVTQTSGRMFLTTIQGFDDTVGPDGSSHTSVQNVTGDVQMVNALSQLLDRVMARAALLAAGNTNAWLHWSNLVAQVETRAPAGAGK